MAVSAVKTWIAGEVLTASDLNALNTNILNNGESLGWPATVAKDLDGQELIFDSDADTSYHASTDDRIDHRVGGRDVLAEDADGFASQGIYSFNLLMNGDFRAAEYGTTIDATTTPANNDDTYVLDGCILLSDGNDAVDVTQETSTVPAGSYAAIRLDVETGNVKFGLLFPIEARDAEKIIGGTASFSFAARRTGTSIDHLRAAIVAWDSTADSITSDVVSAWNAAGSNPTLVTNWTFENTPANLATLTTAYQTFRIENVSIDTSGANNVAVFIWIDDTTTTIGDFLYIADVMFTPGIYAQPIVHQSFPQQLERCKWHYERLVYDSANAELVSQGQATTTAGTRTGLYFSGKRVAPSLTASAAGTFDVVYDAASAANGTSVTLQQIGRKSATFALGVAGTPLTVSTAISITRDGTDTCFIQVDSNL